MKLHNENTETCSSSNNSKLLSDNEIQTKCRQGLLISENFRPDQLTGCCYEFRVGDISYTYDYENKSTRQYKGFTHTIHPFETLTIVSLEKVKLDRKHFLSIFSKGSLFSMGLTPVCTAADPGFKGHLAVTMTNLSIRPIQFKKGQGFIKGTFQQLSEKASRFYIGQHGDATMSWAYPSQFHMEPADFNSPQGTCWNFLPPPIRETINKIQNLEKHIKFITYLFCILIIINIVIPPVKLFFPDFWTNDLERILTITASFVSIIGFVLSLNLYSKK